MLAVGNVALTAVCVHKRLRRFVAETRAKDGVHLFFIFVLLRHFGVAYKYGILLQKISILKNQNKTELSQPRISRYTFSLYSSSLRISCLQCG